MAVRSKRFTPIVVAGVLLLAGVVAVLAWRNRKIDPQLIVTQVMSPGTLVVSGGQVFFSAFVGEGKSLRAIFSVAPRGGAPRRIAAGTMELPSLAVDSEHAYYAVYAEGSVMRVPIAGGAATPLAQGVRHPLAVVRGADALYFSGRVLGGRSIFKLGLGGGTPVAVHSGLAELTTMVADRDLVYAVSGDKIVRVPVSGAATMFAPGAGRMSALAVSGEMLLIAVGGPTPAVLRVPAAGGVATQLFTLKSPAMALAADATHVYAATADREATVLAGPIAGGEPRVLASDPERPSSIAVDGEFVYWTSGEKNGRVLRIPKPRAARAAAT